MLRPSIFFFLISLLFTSACERSPYHGMKEGKVIYDVEIDSEDIPALMQVMMPSEATTWFSEGRSCMVMEGAGGMMEMRMISDPQKKIFANLFSGMGQKMAILSNPDSLKAKMSKKMDKDVDFTGNTKVIAGIKCEEAVITGDSGAVFKVYYTDELDIETPNWGIGFGKIEGLMMEYDIEMRGLRLKLKAKEIVAAKPDPELFTIPADYEIKDQSQKKQ